MKVNLLDTLLIVCETFESDRNKMPEPLKFMLIKRDRENTKERPIIPIIIYIISLFKPRMSHYICNILCVINYKALA